MTDRYYHTPPPPASTRVRCPVCHEAVYSRAGIHPQCAARLADPPMPKGKAKAVPGHLEPGIKPAEQAEGVAAVDLPTADSPPISYQTFRRVFRGDEGR
jgi:hypothetical protein